MPKNLWFKHLFCIVLGLASCTKPASKEVGFNTVYANKKMQKAWEKTYPEILSFIQAPIFKKDTFFLSSTADFRNILNQTISKLSLKGGGVVVVPSGIHQINGSLYLKSNVNLHLSEGTILHFSQNPEHYLPVVKQRWEGTFIRNYSPLIYAENEKNIAITGLGIIDGNCTETWSTWKTLQEPDKQVAREMGNNQIPIADRVFGKNHFLRPTGIEFIECENILLEDFTIQESPFWTIHPVICTNITARRLQVLSGTTNDDGIDPEHCKNVLIEECNIKTEDDCIAIKAGRDQDGWPYPPSENMIIRNNTLNTKVGSGFCIGSEMSAGVRNIFFHDNEITGSEKHAFQFKSNPDRGGFIEEIYMKNVAVSGSVAYAFEFTTDYKGWRGNQNYVKYKDFYFQDIHIEEAKVLSIRINGTEKEPIQRVFFKNVSIRKTSVPIELNHTKDVFLEQVKIGQLNE